MIRVLKRIISDFHASGPPPITLRDIAAPLGLGKITTVIGPRRSGKTFYCFQLMFDLMRQGVEKEDILYLNFEDERLDFTDGCDSILDAWQELYPDRDTNNLHIFFDEIQELPNWEKFVRRIYDTITRKIVLTGSNAKMLSEDIATALRGRSLSVEILPLSFKEFLRFKKVDSTRKYSSKTIANTKKHFEEYLVWGGYPELVEMERRHKLETLQEYFNVMIYRDLLERYELKDGLVLKYLTKRLLESFTKEFSVNKLYNEMKSRGLAISKDSAFKLTDNIMSIYLLTSVEKYEPSVVRRSMSNKKIYLFDNGFASAMRYAFSEDRGKLLENLVFTHLRRMGEGIAFLKNGWECDFIVFPDKGNPTAIQVVSELTNDNIKREIKGLEKAVERFPNCSRLLLTDRRQERLPIPKGIEYREISDWLLE